MQRFDLRNFDDASAGEWRGGSTAGNLPRGRIGWAGRDVGPGLRLVLRNRAPALTDAALGNETTALSLFEQPFCSGVQGAKVTLLRVRAVRRIAKSSGPTVGGQGIDRTGDLVATKYKEETAGADTGGLSACRVVLGTLQGVTVHHHGRVQTIVSGPAATR